jgi:hypothetical protein
MVKNKHVAVFQTNYGYDVFVVEGYKYLKSGKAKKIIPANDEVSTFENKKDAMEYAKKLKKSIGVEYIGVYEKEV